MSETFEALHFLADLKDKNVCRYLKFSFKFFKSVEKSSSICRISSAMKKVFFFVPENDEVMYVERDLGEENLNEVSA